MATRQRPCSVCKRWFFPDLRVGGRQRTCGADACRAEQRRRTQAQWAGRNPDYWAARRLRAQAERLQDGGAAQDATTPAAVAPPEPRVHPPPAAMARVPWDMVQDAFGPQGLVLIAFLVRLAHRAAQDAMRAQLVERTGEIDRLRAQAAQDATDSGVGGGHDPP
jgi:hypothetical protein